MNDTNFITTSIPYVNAKPHIGHAIELVQADALSRYYRLRGMHTVLQTGTDENAQKNVEAAKEQNVPVQLFVDRNSALFSELVTALGISPDRFIRTSSTRHKIGVAEFWNRIDPPLFYKQSYKGLYCTGCEAFLLERDLENGLCPDHLAAPTLIQEDNIFFRLSGYQERLENLIESDTIHVVPDVRKREVLSFIRSGLQDISVSRDSSRTAGWGITVPADPSQTIYVWIDALINYVTGSGFGSDSRWEELWNETTRKIHVIGKNVWKFHAVYWPAMLLAAGLPVPNRIVVHGFLTANRVKMSKSLGNVVDPMAEIEAFEPTGFAGDALRFFLLSLSPFVDTDYSRSAMVVSYNEAIAGGIGSATTRVTALCQRFGLETVDITDPPAIDASFFSAMDEFRFDRGIAILMDRVDLVNREIADVRPWEAGADTSEVSERLETWVGMLYSVGYWLQVISPRIGEAVCSVLSTRPLRKPDVLFPRMKM